MPTHRQLLILLLSILASIGFSYSAHAQTVQPSPNDGQRIAQLERKVSNLESKAGQLGVVAWLFAAFCALWAQNTRRSAWLWFFLGLFFNVITVIVLLVKNSDDRSMRSAQPTS